MESLGGFSMGMNLQIMVRLELQCTWSFDPQVISELPWLYTEYLWKQYSKNQMSPYLLMEFRGYIFE